MAMFSAQLAFRSVKFDEAAFRAARHILHLDASHGATSVVAHGTQALLAEVSRTHPDLQVQHLRLWDESTRAKMEYNMEHVRSKLAVLGGNASEDDMQAQVQHFAGIEELAKQVASAQALVVSVPMWNYSVPWVVKQYFDCVLHPGLTFREVPGSRPEGLLGGGRPLVIVTSSGGAAAADHLTPWLRDVGAMMGFDNAVLVSAPGVAHGDRQAALDSVARSAVQAARVFSEGPGARAGGAAEQAGGDDEASEADGEEEKGWSHEKLLKWLRAQGGLSKDCFESIEAARIDGQLFATATEGDWANEELGLEDDDVARIMELQRQFRRLIGMEAMEG